MHTEKGHAKDYYIEVSLPRSYYKTDTRKYPVIYLTDADYCFNMAKDLTLVLDWQQREVIVVGIGYGSPERLRKFRGSEYGEILDEFGEPGWAQFLSFIQNRLIPKVESEYRINPQNRTLYGWSWGVQFISAVLENNPLLFQNYIIGGGGRKADYVENLYHKWPDLPVNMYFGTGENDGNLHIMMKFYENILDKGFSGLQTKLEVYPGLAHEMITKGVLLDRGMKWVYAKKPIEPRLKLAMKSGGAEKCLDEFNKLLKTNPDDFDFDPGHLKSFAESLGRDGNPEAQQAILKYVEREYPLRKVTIHILPESVPDTATLYITGNHTELGDWDPQLVAMKHLDAKTWGGTYQIISGTELEFKITRGSWETQAANSSGAELSNFKAYIKVDTVITKVVKGWVDLK
jgi:predicted alpha/beta superfamily hydrolase